MDFSLIKFRSCQSFTLLNLFVCYVAYHLSYACLAVSSVKIVNEKFITKSEYGIIVSVGKIAQILPMFFSGMFVDLFSGKIFFGVGILLCGISIALFPVVLFPGPSNTLQIIWFCVFNALFSIFGCFPWNGVLKIESKWVSYKSIGKANAFLSLSWLFGDSFCRFFISCLLLIGLDWEYVFWISAGISITAGIYSILVLRESPTSCGMEQPPSSPEVEEESHKKHSLNINGEENEKKKKKISWFKTFYNYLVNVLFPILKDLRTWLFFLWYFYPKIVRYLLVDWIGLYLANQYKFSDYEAGFVSSAFPFLGGIGCIYLGYLFDKTSNEKYSERFRYVLLLLFELFNVIFFFLFFIFHLSGKDMNFNLIFASGNSDLIWHFSIVFLLLVALAYLVWGQYAVSGYLAISLGGKEGCGTIMSLFDSVAYVASFFANLVVGSVVNLENGWNIIWILFTFIGFIPLFATGILFFVAKKKER